MRLNILLKYLTVTSLLITIAAAETFTVTFVPDRNETLQAKNDPQAVQIVEVETEAEAELYPQNVVHILSSDSYVSPVDYSATASDMKDVADSYQRYEVQFKTTKFFKHPRIPISPCHDSTDGFGGSTGYSASLGFSTGVSLSVGLGTVISNFLTLSLGTTLSNSISASESITCSVSEGDVVQVFAEPWIFNGEYRSRTYYSAFGKKISKSAWTSYQKHDFPVSITPAPFCVTGVEKVSCSEPPQTNIFLRNGAI